jgi:DNA-binding LytR/AlgR family response regulator
MRRLLTFLHQPYPVPDCPAVQWRRAALIGLFVSGFLLVFEPFGISLWRTDFKALKVAGFGLVSMLVTLAMHVGGPALVPSFFRENCWTVGRAALYLNLNLLLIATANLFYLAKLQGISYEKIELGWMVSATFLLGLFPTVGTTVATYIRQLHENQRRAAAVHLPTTATAISDERARPEILFREAQPPPPKATLASTLTFTAENGKDALTIATAAVLYLEAADNYCTVVHDGAGAAARALLRASLSRLATQASAQGAVRLVRVHRSYLVNLARVTRVSGNAQGYRLHLPVPDGEPVPVGRTYAEAVLAELQATAVRP